MSRVPPTVPPAGDHAPSGHLGDRLSSMLDGEMAPEELAAAEIHLGRCVTCERELAAERRTRQLLRGLEPPSPPESFVPGLVRRHRRFTLLLAVGSVLVAVAAALVFALMSPHADVTPPVNRFERIHATSTPSPDPISEMAPAGIPGRPGR